MKKKLSLCEYVDSMVWVKGSEPYQNILALINKGRQFYIEAINRRAAKDKTRKTTESTANDTLPQPESPTKDDAPTVLPKEESVAEEGEEKVEATVN